jgi:hypothetical protein
MLTLINYWQKGHPYLPSQQEEKFDSIHLLEKECVLSVFSQNLLLLQLQTETACIDSPKHQLEGNTANCQPGISTYSANATRLVHSHIHCKDSQVKQI